MSEPEPTFVHADDVKWQHVRTQRHPDGETRSVREQWFAIGREPQYLSMLGRWDPGMIVHRHGHLSHQVVFVLSGGMWCGERWCPAGTHIELPVGAAFGPIVAGDEGATFLELTDGDFRSWGDRPELYEQALAERGVTPLPDPPIDLGEWFTDRRGYWTDDRTTGGDR